MATSNLGSSEHRERILAAIGQLCRLSELFQKRREQPAARPGLAEHQWGGLGGIATEHFMPSMFARQRDSSAAAVSKTLRQLIDKELIAVSVDSSDGRQRRYELTQRGNSVLVELRKHREHAIDHVWRTFGSESLQQFCSFAGELGDKLETLIAHESQKTDTAK